MTSNNIIDGRELARQTLTQLQDRISLLKTQYAVTPSLRVIMVGDNPSSAIYVRNKQKRAIEAGIDCQVVAFDDSISEPELLKAINECNSDKLVHGIIVQLPLPLHIHSKAVIESISPLKDVDGFHPLNVGMLYTGNARQDSTRHGNAFVACTAKASLYLIQTVYPNIASKNIVVIGRSNIVGRPLASLLLQHNATVTICHSYTKNLQDFTRKADVVVCAMGQPKFLNMDYFTPTSVIIDVGITRLSDGNIVGDVDFNAVASSVKNITPVPGGVGPMTIACLLENTVEAAEMSVVAQIAERVITV